MEMIFCNQFECYHIFLQIALILSIRIDKNGWIVSYDWGAHFKRWFGCIRIRPIWQSYHCCASCDIVGRINVQTEKCNGCSDFDESHGPLEIDVVYEHPSWQSGVCYDSRCLTQFPARVSWLLCFLFLFQSPLRSFIRRILLNKQMIVPFEWEKISFFYNINIYSILIWNRLRSSNPKKRYELFLKATQLDVIIEKLNGCLQQTNTAKVKYMTQKRQYMSLKEIQKKAHDKLNQFKSMEPLKVCTMHTHRRNFVVFIT